MPRKVVVIDWNEPNDMNWLAEDNIALALHAYCPNTLFDVLPETEITAERERFISQINHVDRVNRILDKIAIAAKEYLDFMTNKEGIAFLDYHGESRRLERNLQEALEWDGNLTQREPDLRQAVANEDNDDKDVVKGIE
jgi:hypothetical protein